MSGPVRSLGIRRIAVALAVVAIACAPAIAALAGRGADSSERLSERAAVTRALADPTVSRYLAQSGYTRETTVPLDRRMQRVSFFNGSRIVLEVAVDRDGKVKHSLEYFPGYVRSGSEVFQRPAILMLVLCAVFALMTARLPLRNVANLDVLVLAASTATIVLQNERLFEASVYVGYVLLAYLATRLAWIGLGPARAGAASPTRPLLEALTPRWDLGRRRRTLGLAAAGAAAMLAIVSVPGGIVVDVGFASIAGATDILHGQAPYGHIPPEIVHGDTYPLLAYASYVPAAALAPVRDAFSNPDGALWVSAIAALLAAIAIWRSAAHLESSRRSTAGVRLAIAWLVFPPTLVGASSGSNDLVAAACVAGALAFAAHAGRPVFLLALAGWVKVVPLALLPLWVARARAGGLLRAVAAAAAVSAAVIVWLAMLDGGRAIAEMVDGISFQAERGSLLSLWTQVGTRVPQVLVQCAVCGIVALAAVRAWTDRAFAGDVRRVAALSAAIMLGFQLAANYWTPVYLTWVFPLMAVALLAGDREREPASA
jgi:cytochrome b